MKLPTAISAIISALAGIAAMHGQPAAECGTGPAGNCRGISGNGPQYAVVGLSVNFLREAPDYTAELGTQALMGDIVEIVDRNGYWCKRWRHRNWKNTGQLPNIYAPPGKAQYIPVHP